MKVKYLLLALIFILVLAAAVLGYNLLTALYTPEQSGDFASDTLSPAPDFTVYDGDGNPVTLSSFEGKPVVVNFWATWCGPCQSELPYFSNLSHEYAGEVEFMMVDLTDGQRETREYVEMFVEVNDYKFPVYYDLDMDAAMTYQTYSIPYTIFVSTNGELVSTHTGAMNEETLRNYIDALLEVE